MQLQSETVEPEDGTEEMLTQALTFPMFSTKYRMRFLDELNFVTKAAMSIDVLWENESGQRTGTRWTGMQAVILAKSFGNI